jgi:ADP-ribose pyrophosphatase
MAPVWLFEHPVVRVEGVRVQTGLGEATWARLHLPDWVNVIPVTADGQVVFVRQHRCGIDASTLEIPGGCVEPGEDPAFAASRELREETGYSGPLVALGAVWSNPAIQNNRTHLFLARPAVRSSDPDPDPGEQIEVVLRPLASVVGLLDAGAIDHALAVVALERALRRGML